MFGTIGSGVRHPCSDSAQLLWTHSTFLDSPTPGRQIGPRNLAEPDRSAAPADDAPRLVLADWLRDHGDEAAAGLAARGRGVLGGWLAMARYERATGRSAAADMPHLTAQFHPDGPSAPAPDEAVASVAGPPP
jgi:hypothetical protein